MSALTRERLQQELHLKQRQIDLIMAIDHVRDTMPDPSAMMTALVNVLADQLQVDLCCICLTDRETGELTLKAINDRHKQFGQIRADVFREVESKIMTSSEVLVLIGEKVPLQLRELPDINEQVTMAIISIRMKEKSLGMLVFARIGKSFGTDDVALIKIAESQVDSAVIQTYEYYTLQQRNKELEVIYRVDNIRDQHLSFDAMLNTVLAELQCAIQAEAGFIMLYNQAEQLLELRATTRNDLFPLAPHYAIINRVATESLQKAKMVWQHDLSAELRSILCLPLILENKIIGVLGVVNRFGRATFDSEDRRLLNAIASQMDTAIFESLQQRHLREVLGRSVDPHIMERLLTSSEADFLNCERSVLSVLYADIRGSTALAEQTEPDLLLGFINDYLGRMTDVILAHEGTLDKFVGDEVMALFGAPFPRPDHALRAIQVALKMQQAHEAVMDTWQKRGVTRSPIGIGIATGELIVGEIGCRKRTDYTVIGRAANLGARLCGVAQGGEIIISQATYDLVKDNVEVEPIHGVKLKGVPEGMVIYSVKHLLRGLSS
ncbi:adenylate/guanylate cyclase with GAF sensor(S) [Candidatus Vecturithrix granuli]|uniref:Adenylate/guanylate cyclase with GAF sensor(S) n=1 Tax=Vecturithrix granuli TaxID=1499967 RepID=A0A081C3A6_VECG1|nr:adenylate/guanylate cyclase with GAF sensor(S) [Candidatus Vecturithrix granuli]